MLQMYMLISITVSAFYTDVQTMDTQISVYTHVPFNLFFIKWHVGQVV